MTLTRLPSGRRASQIGLDSSRRRPTWLTMVYLGSLGYCLELALRPGVLNFVPETGQFSY